LHRHLVLSTHRRRKRTETAMTNEVTADKIAAVAAQSLHAAPKKASAKKGAPKAKKADKPTRLVPRARERRFWTSSGGPKELLQRHRETGRFDMADAGGTSPSRN